MALRKSALDNAVAAAIEALEERRMLSAAPALTVTNPDAVPGSYNRLFFNQIGTPNATYPNDVHDSQTLQLTDSGTAPLTISSITASGPFTVSNEVIGTTAQTLPVTLAAGQTLTITVTFTQSTVPAHSGNETNYNNNAGDGASITGSLTISSNDPTTPTDTLVLAGYYQAYSEDNDEPDLSQIVNTLAGYDTTLITSAQQNAAPESSYPTDFVNGTTSNPDVADYYGQEVYSVGWTAANSSLPVTITYLANFRTEGNTVNTYWYNSTGGTSLPTSHLLFTTTQDQGQQVLPSDSADGAPISASFTPNGQFGFRVDNEYSYDGINAANGNDGGGGHHFRFYPLIGSDGQVVPNAWIVAMDYAVIQSENFDFQDNVFIVTNMQPTNAPLPPSNLAATSTATPTLSWSAVTYSAGLQGYNVYRADSAAGPYTLLTSSPISATTYTDTNAPTGVTLFYQVTAVGSPSSTAPTAPTESAPATASANTPAGPYAGSFSVTAFTGEPTAINVLPYDSDTAGTLLPNSVVVSNFSGGGSASTPNPTTGVFNYTSHAGFVGTETFTYTVTDTTGHTSAPGTVTVTVTAPVATQSVANNDTADTLANTAVNISVLSVDTPASGLNFNLSSEKVTTGPSHGTASVNSDGTITYTPADGFVGADSFQYSVADNGSSPRTVSATVDLNVGVALTPGTGATAVKEVRYTDTNGTTVTVTLNRGVADLYFAGSGSVPANATRGLLTVSGGVSLANAALSDTSTASSMVITGARNGAVNLGGITDATAMGVISARTAVFNGSIDLAGGVHELLLGSSANNTTSTPSPVILGPTATNPVTGTAVQNDIIIFQGPAQNTNLTSTLTIGTLEAKGWTSPVADVATNIIAPVINTLAITGAMQANVTLNGTAAYDLGTAHITGATNSGFWDVTSGARTVSLASVAAGFGGMSFGGALATMAVSSGGLPADVSAASITTLSVRGNLSGDVTAGTARTIAVTGAVAGSVMTFSAAGRDLTTLSAAGGITGSIIDSTGSIGTIVTDTLSGDTISAGVASGTTLADVTTANIGSQTISALRVTGRSASFADTTVIAHTITSATLGAVNGSNGGVPEGVAVVTTSSLTATENGTIVRVTPRSTASPTAFGDFVIELVTA